jgi:mannose-6-phosphate isomerase
MDVLRPAIRPYAWGSRHAIAELQGRPVPAPGPEAELWMGSHPSAPSGADRAGRPVTLDAVIAADPERELGRACVARFGPRLPFLLKVLSADHALSIQVHPSRAQAQAGFRAETQRGLPPGDPARNYVDDWPKPELLCALTPFEVLAGLRPPPDAARFLRALALDQLAPLAAALEAAPEPPEVAPSLPPLESPPSLQSPVSPRLPAPPQSPVSPKSPASPQPPSVAPDSSSPAASAVMAGVLGRILDWPADNRAALVAEVVAACARLALEGSAASPYADAAAAVVRVAADHPGDLGVVASLLMRYAVLAPGQAMFLPAGGLHAYLKGTGIELLANSDNVVRAGLTGKHLDVPELLKLLDPAVSVPVLSPRVLPDGITWFDTPAPEFRLYQVDLAGHTVTLPGEGPRVILCTAGSVVLRSEPGQTAEIGRGGSCFIPDADGAVRCTGQAHLFVASPGPL